MNPVGRAELLAAAGERKTRPLARHVRGAVRRSHRMAAATDWPCVDHWPGAPVC